MPTHKDSIVNYLTSRNKYIKDTTLTELCNKVDTLERNLDKNRGSRIFANGITSISGELTYMLGRISSKGELLLLSQYGVSINTDSKHTRLIHNKIKYSEPKLFRRDMPLNLNQINSYIIVELGKNISGYNWESLINRLNSD